jgi:hypothetical protein
MSLAILLLNLLPGLLSGIPQISGGIKQLISDVTSSISAILGSGVVSAPSVNTALSAWLGVITALKSDPNLPANTLNAIAQLEKAVQAAATNDLTASQSVDWTKIVVIATV